MATVVQIAVYRVGVVHEVALAGGVAGGELRCVNFVVRATGAGSALGMSPFRIRHDGMSCFVYAIISGH